MTTTAPAASAETAEQILEVNNIEVIYDHVILVLKGVSLSVPRGGITALLGANGAGKTTTLKAISNLLHAERGEVTKGSILFGGDEVQNLSPNDLVRRGCIQVMEGRHCFGHLSVEDNLLTGAFTRRDGQAAIREDLDLVYTYFPRLKERRNSQAGYTSGGEQQMTAIGRALMSRPKMILLDEPSMGLAPQLVEENFRDRQKAQRGAGRFLPAGRAEHQCGPALREIRLHSGIGPCRSGWRGEGAARERRREGILPWRRRRGTALLPQCKTLQAAQALALMIHAFLVRNAGTVERHSTPRELNFPHSVPFS